MRDGEERRALVDGTSPFLRRGIDELRREVPELLTDNRTTKTQYTQYYRGVRVFNGGLWIEQDRRTGVERVGGYFRPGIEVSTQPTITDAAAVTAAAARFRGVPIEALRPMHPCELLASDAGNLSWRLVWRVEFVGRLALVDALTGEVTYAIDSTREE